MTAVYLALAAGVAATTITKAKVFAPLRDWVQGLLPWLGALIRCPYCVSHWLVFGLQAVYQQRLLHSSIAAVDVIVSSFPLIGLAVLVPAALRRLYSFEADQAPDDSEWLEVHVRG